MRTILILGIISLGCLNVRSESTNSALTFYVVSEQKIDGGRFINTVDLPQLGYIAARPDLTVTNLADVFPSKVANIAIIGDGKGNHRVVPTHPPPSLTIKLTPADAKKFTALTEKAVEKRLLIMVREKPLTAPKVLFPIDSPAFGIDFTNMTEMKRIEDELRKLLH